MVDIAPGAMLAGKYQIVGPIAQGSFAAVWRAEDTSLGGRQVAVKVLHAHILTSAAGLQRFQQEAANAAQLSHSNVATVYDYGQELSADGRTYPYLVMELVTGETLGDRLKRKGSLEPTETLRVLAQVADGLGAAHKAGVVHRDIKPHNILMRDDDVVKVTDFGIARGEKDKPLTEQGMVIGTARYMSPEQAKGRPIGPPADVYSLGVVGYECLTGRPPFDADDPVAVLNMHITDKPPALPAAVDAGAAALIMKALSKSAEDRWPNGAEFAAAIRDVQQGRTPTALLPPSPPTPSSERTAPAQPKVIAGAVGGGVSRAVAGSARPREADVPERPRRPLPWVLFAAALVIIAVLAVALVVKTTSAPQALSPGPTDTTPAGVSTPPTAAVVLPTASSVITTTPTRATGATTPATTPPPPPVTTYQVDLMTALGYGCCPYRATIGGKIFQYIDSGAGGYTKRVQDGTCTSLTLTAGIPDASSSATGTLQVEVAAGQQGGGSMAVRRGALTTQTFSLQPGDYQLVYNAGSSILVNGTATCMTPTGQIPRK